MVELFFKKLQAAVTVPEMNPIMNIFLRKSRRQRQPISLALFKMSGEILRDDCIRILFWKIASSIVCNFSRNELDRGHFPANFLKAKTTFLILFQNWPK